MKEGALKYVWEIRRDGRRSWLIGINHILPYSCEKELEKYVSLVNDVGLESLIGEEAIDISAQFHILYKAPSDAYNIDKEAYVLSRRHGKKIHRLETPEEFKEVGLIMMGYTIGKILGYVAGTRKDYDSQKAIELYESGNLRSLMGYVNEYLGPEMQEHLLYQRDRRMYGRSKPLLDKGRSLIVVGAMHCDGFVRMARRDGYKVRRTEKPTKV